jgi:hypothetical protein
LGMGNQIIVQRLRLLLDAARGNSKGQVSEPTTERSFFFRVPRSQVFLSGQVK